MYSRESRYTSLLLRSLTSSGGGKWSSNSIKNKNTAQHVRSVSTGGQTLNVRLGAQDGLTFSRNGFWEAATCSQNLTKRTEPLWGIAQARMAQTWGQELVQRSWGGNVRKRGWHGGMEGREEMMWWTGGNRSPKASQAALGTWALKKSTFISEIILDSQRCHKESTESPHIPFTQSPKVNILPIHVHLSQLRSSQRCININYRWYSHVPVSPLTASLCCRLQSRISSCIHGILAFTPREMRKPLEGF